MLWNFKRYVQAIHGRFLICASLSTVAGPTILLTLRKMSENAALQDLLGKVDPAKFQGTFGVDVSQANALIEAKTLTISKLMTIMPNVSTSVLRRPLGSWWLIIKCLPQGTIDPSPFIYNNTMYTMAGLVGVASMLHFMVKPVDQKYFEKSDWSIKHPYNNELIHSAIMTIDDYFDKVHAIFAMILITSGHHRSSWGWPWLRTTYAKAVSAEWLLILFWIRRT